MQVSRTAQRGFTIVEIMIVIGIIGVLMAVLLPVFRAQQKRARQDAARVQMKRISANIDQYYDDVGEYPTTLKDLVVEPSDEKVRENWRGPYYETKDKKEPRDPFGHPYRYSVTSGAEHPFELFSYGAREGKGAPKKDWIDVWKI